ncbi:tail protein X [Methylobacterium nigriterrae]|uniref:tail protein X n=1 Tax=Methylobacterium nigriterrae TaxID=3127512 RepID=UPI0030132F6E
MATTVKVSGVGITLELLLWRHGKRRGATSARLSETLALNPGLAALGPFLTLGTLVTIPDLPPVTERARTTAPAVSLFD